MLKIDTVAALKRIPAGTKLVLVGATFASGPLRSGRIFKQARSKDCILTVDEPTHKNHGKDSYLPLPSGVEVTPTAKGFRVVDRDGFVEYEFVESEGGG